MRSRDRCQRELSHEEALCVADQSLLQMHPGLGGAVCCLTVCPFAKYAAKSLQGQGGEHGHLGKLIPPTEAK